MIGDLTKNWWVVVLRGVLAIVFGALAFFLPGITLAALVLLFGAFAFADGVFAIISATRKQSGRPWWALALQGVAGIATGVITAFWPGITALSLLVVISAWALASGALEIVAAVRLRKVIAGEWLLALAGVASIAFGILLVLAPGPGALALLWVIAGYSVVFGVLFLWLGFKLRSWGRHLGEPLEHAV
jgi:uncharacterized membrane protein HdeD (DUF308 family)